MKKQTATKEQIIQAVQLCARKLKRIPTVRELRRMSGIQGFEVRKVFRTIGAAMKAAGLEARGVGYVASTEELLMEWAELARKLGKLPTMADVKNAKRHSTTPYLTRFRLWTRVGFCFRRFAEEMGITAQWQDVLEMVRRTDRTLALESAGEAGHGPGRRSTAVDETGLKRSKVRSDRPVYGSRLGLPEMAYAPVNEAGVMFLFGALARRLGFQVHRIQTEFPDCKAMQEVAPGRLQRMRIEFEYASKNFLAHGHDPKGCDVIVCWIHNWPECPENIEVIELSKVVMVCEAG